VIRAGFEDFLSGRVSFEQEKFQIDPGVSSPKDKRVSMKLDEKIYAEVQRKAAKFGGVSGLVRSILENTVRLLASSSTKTADGMRRRGNCRFDDL
jgi:hypothetical protein